MSRRAPDLKGWPVIGPAIELGKRGPLNVFVDGQRTLGDVFGFSLLGRYQLVVCHPDILREMVIKKGRNFIKGPAYDEFRKLGGEGLISSEGARWRSDRRTLQPAFRRARIAALEEMMVRCIAERLDAVFAEDAPVDVGDVMMRVALVIMGYALFDQDLSDSATATAAAMTEALSLLLARSDQPISLPLWMPSPGNRAVVRALDTLDAHVRLVLDRYRTSGKTESGALLLEMLANARDAETGEPFSDRALRDHIVTLFVAGHETTALTLTWCVTLLHAHPDLRARVEAEVDVVLGRRDPTVADLDRLVYTQQVLKETLRLRPPLWAVARNAVEDDTLGGFAVPAGTWTVGCLYLAHRHPDVWPDPERFDPDRFAPDADIRSGAWEPFSLGPRKCIGDRFAMMEMTFTLAMLIQRGWLERVDDDPVDWVASISLRPARPVMATPRAR